MSTIRIPNRFEALLEQSGSDYPLLLYAVEQDLQRFDYLRRLAATQGAGVLSFVVGAPGCGKTTAVYAASVFMADRFGHVFSVPHSVPLRDLPRYLEAEMPDANGKCSVFLLDGREISDDEVGLRQLMSYLNQMLRRRPDVIVCWPTSDSSWYAELRSLAEKVGAEALSPDESDVAVRGPDKSDWMGVLERLLIQSDLTLDDLSITPDAVSSMADATATVGSFLHMVGKTISEHVDIRQMSEALPEVVFVISSSGEVAGEANRLRRAGSLLVKSNELLAYSSKSRAAKWWRARNDEPAHHLGYMISLFRARLTTLSASSVNYACIEFGPDALRQAVRSGGISRSSKNSDTTFRSTDLFRFLNDSTTSELTSTQKGRMSDSTLRSYDAVQRLSRTHHLAINQSVCAVAERNVPRFVASTGSYEVHFGEQDLITDAVVPLGGEPLSLEFHHLSPASCKAASMSQYIMEKLQYYAIAHNLIPV